jgi:hypothetical protein
LTSDAQPGAPGDTSIFNRQLVLQDGTHVVAQGTSFSAPHVTGAVALLFERDPARDALDIRNDLSATARTDNFTGQVPNSQWGFGKLDVDTFLGDIEGGTEATGIVLYFPIAPSRFNGFDSLLLLTGIGLNGASLEVNTTGVLPGTPAQPTKVIVPPLTVVPVYSSPVAGQLNFGCVPQPSICQLFVHRLDQPREVQNFTAALLIFTEFSFQFITPFSFTTP